MSAPTCRSGDDLRSVELAEIAYPAIFTTRTSEPEYTGEDRELFDAGTTFNDKIDCRNCGSLDMTLADLLPDSMPAPVVLAALH